MVRLITVSSSLAEIDLTLLIGELAPKRIAMQRTEGWALLVARPLDLLSMISRPAVWLLGVATNLVVATPAHWQGRDCLAVELSDAEQTLRLTTQGGGNRPSFTGAAGPELGERLYQRVLATARSQHRPVAAGEFGADMQVHLVNDGPVTIPIRV